MIGLKKGMSYLLCAAMVLTMGPVSSFAGEAAQESETVTFIDMPDGWARAGLEHGVANGLLKGYRTAAGFEIRPAGKITRAELVTAVNRAFGAIETASLDGVTDVDPDAWYATEIAEAVAMRTMTKAEKMRPNDKVTRQEAFTILARAYEIGGGTRADLAGFNDADKVAEYAVDSLGALVKAGFVSGSEGKLNPTGDMTRAEFAKIMDNLTAVYVHDGGEYSDDVTGNVIVNTGGACLKDMNIDGDLIVAEGVGEGDVDLISLNVTGDIIVKAGGDHSIRFDGVNARYLIIDKEQGNTPVRTALSGKMSVKEVFVKSDAIIDTANADKSSNLGTVLISGEAVKNLKLNGWFNTVENLAADLKLTATGTIEKLTAEVKTEVAGGAEIKDVSNQSGSDIKVNDKVVQSENKPEGTTEGGNKTDAVNNGGSSGRSSDGGSRNGGKSGNSDAPKLTDEQKIAADKAKIEKSSIRISVPYKTKKDSVKAMLTEKVNGLSGLYNKTWEADTFEKFNSTLYDTEQTVDISFKLGETVTEIVKAVVYVEPMTVADKRAADKSRLESLTAPPAVSVGYYAISGDVEKAIEDLVNNDTEYFCSDWRVTGISVFLTRMVGQQPVTVKLTSGEVTTENVQFSVTTLPMTDTEKREEDKALLESDRTEISANVAYSATASDAKAALALNVNAISGLYFTDWEVAEMTGFEEHGTGEQTVSVILKSGNVRTAAVSAKVTVAGITAAESLPLEKARLEAFTETEVNVGFTDTEEQVKDKLCRKIVKNLSDSGWTFMNTWQADTLSGFERGVAGTQNVTFTLKSGETVTDPITAEVVVPEPTDEEFLALQKDLIEAAASDLSFTVGERARLDELEGIIESKIREINSIWSVYRIDGFTAGSGGDQNVTVYLDAEKGDNYITTTIVVKVTVTVLPVEEKLASDKAKIESALAGKDF
nr:S-layer homology domain-containing protein [Clostridia bacterium]